MLTIARDITERHLMQEKLQLAATVFENTAEGVLITDIDQRISAVNRAFSEITGYSEIEALGQTPRLLASGQHDSAFYAAMWHQLTAEGHWQGEIYNKRKNGELYPGWLTISAVRNNEQAITHFVAVFADISSLKHAQAKLDYQAHHDPLTGLPNRALFENRLQAALACSQTSNRQGAVLFLDLDRFKHINDSLGHPVGDLLLKGIAQRLKEQVRDVDTVARLGGDEFIILLPGLHRPSDASAIANKLLAGFSAPFQAGEHEFFTSASIGISLYPQDGTDVSTLIRNADAAMYRSKAKGRNRVEAYTRDLTAQASERIALEHELRRAVERNEMSLSYQPSSASRPRPWSVPKRSSAGVTQPSAKYRPSTSFIWPKRTAPFSSLAIGYWSKPACRCTTGRGTTSSPPVDQPRRRATAPRRSGQTHRAAAQDLPAQGRRPATGDHRELHHEPGRGSPGRAARVEAAGRAIGHRRFRHRLLVAELPQAPAAGHPQDRQVVHPRAAG